jgi:nucleoside-diphosphate-sugar epimerase
MMGIMKRAFVLGAGGQVGRAVVQALGGWHVVAVTSKDLDREDTRALRQASAGADVVVDVIPYTAAHAHQLLSLDVGAVIAVSSAAVYGELGSPMPVPVPESHPRRGGGEYADGKVAMEDVLLGQDRMPATVLRPCAIHGPGSRAPREWYFEKRRLDGRTRAAVAYGGRSLFHTTAAQNLGELIRLAAERRASGAFNAGDPEPPTVAEIAELIGIEPVPVEGEPPGSSTPWSVEHPFVVDMAKAERELGYAPVTTYAQALPATLTWLHEATEFPGLDRYPEDLFDYATEDRLLA